MSDVAMPLNPAQDASARALASVYACLDRGVSFLLEAGAGAGKTYTLVKALQYLIRRDQHKLPKRRQKVACITFTNVAKEEIEARTDRSPLIYCDTIHGFCWSLIAGFQRPMRDRLAQMEAWADKVAEAGGLGQRTIEYSLGHRRIKDDNVSIHHDDVIPLTLSLMERDTFRRIVAAKYPVILIDEYQDTSAAWVEAIKRYFLGRAGSPQLGFFGDHWQKIYGDGCGKIEHASLTVIDKQANFRSVTTIVDCLNRMRPELPQFVEDPEDKGTILVFHTNAWRGARLGGQHWKGDLPPEVADAAFQTVIETLGRDGWDLSSDVTKILMLTHRGLAGKQGYSSIPGVFSFNDSFTKKEDPHIAFFADVLEPAYEAYISRKYGEMFQVLGGGVPAIKRQTDKQKWTDAMERLVQLRDDGTVGDVVDHMMNARRPKLPDAVERRERELAQFDPEAGEEMPRPLRELAALRIVPYKEIIALTRYLSGHSPFETKHGVKGAEFENVLVVIGRGWNQYNFNEMLELAEHVGNIPASKHAFFERNRNLFYVCCSRPKRRLAMLFTQELSDGALRTLAQWFGSDSMMGVNL